MVNPQTQTTRRVGQAGWRIHRHRQRDGGSDRQGDKSTDTGNEKGGAGRLVNPQTQATGGSSRPAGRPGEISHRNRNRNTHSPETLSSFFTPDAWAVSVCRLCVFFPGGKARLNKVAFLRLSRRNPGKVLYWPSLRS